MKLTEIAIQCLYIIHVKNLILIANSNILRDRGNAEVGVYYYRECFARSQRRFRGFSKNFAGGSVYWT